MILLHLEDETSVNKVRVLKTILETYSQQLSDNFIVVTEKRVRFAKQQN